MSFTPHMTAAFERLHRKGDDASRARMVEAMMLATRGEANEVTKKLREWSR